jgi:hypothetical protein
MAGHKCPRWLPLEELLVVKRTKTKKSAPDASRDSCREARRR